MKPRRTIVHVVDLTRRDRRFRRRVSRWQAKSNEIVAVLCLRALKRQGVV